MARQIGRNDKMSARKQGHDIAPRMRRRTRAVNQKQRLAIAHDLDMKSEITRFDKLTYITMRPRTAVTVEI